MWEIIAVLKQKTLNTSCTAAAKPRVWVYAGTWAKQVEEAELLVQGIVMCFVVWKPWDTGVVFAQERKAQVVRKGVCTRVGRRESLAGTGVEYGSKHFPNCLRTGRKPLPSWTLPRLCLQVRGVATLHTYESH